jgi:hypothetical protein
MKIRKFNESSPLDIPSIYAVIVFDGGGFILEDESKSFSNQMLAADYFIKEINDRYDKDFEPFYEDGVRLFSSIEENEDYDKCINYSIENECDVEIIQLPLLTKPEDLNI